jgi:hypothetical protein
VNFDLKRLSPEAVPVALKKAEHYRLLNEPLQAESICRDILETEPNHKQALITLILALTDQFGLETARKAEEAEKLLEGVKENYEHDYYAGLICERRATAYLERDMPGTGGWAYDWYRRAMEMFDKAAKVRPPGNDDALLRWNCCARIIMQKRLEPVSDTYVEPALE